MLEIQEMQLEKNNDDPNTQPRCNQDKIELDERYFIGMQWKECAGLQIALQLATADSHLEPATITTILLTLLLLTGRPKNSKNIF